MSPVLDAPSGPRTLRTLIAARTINQLGAFSLPYLTVLLIADVHASLTVAGAIVSVFGLATIPSRLAGGRLVTVIGYRRTIIAGLVGCAGAQIGLAAAHTVTLAAVCAVLLGLAFEIYEPASQGMIADAVTPDLRVRAFGTLNAALAAAGIATGILGALIGRWSLRGLFAIDALTCLACAALITRMRPADRPPSPVTDDITPARIRPWRDTMLLTMLGCGTASALIFLTIAMALPLTLTDRGHPATDAGWMFAISGLTIVAGQPLLRRARTNTPSHRALPIGILILAIGLTGYAIAHSLSGFAIATIIWSTGDVLIIGHTTAIVAALAPAHGRARYLAVYGTSWGIAGILTPITTTQILTRSSSTTLWTALAALALLLAATQTHVIRQLKQRPDQPA